MRFSFKHSDYKHSSQSKLSDCRNGAFSKAGMGRSHIVAGSGTLQSELRESGMMEN